MNRTQFWIAGGVVLLAVAFVGWKSSRPPRVETLTVAFEDVTSTLAVSGVLEATDRATVASQLPTARVRSVRVDIGDPIKPGEILVTLDDDDFIAQISAAEAQIQQSDAQSRLYDTTARTAIQSLALAEQALASVTDLQSLLATAQTNQQLARARLNEAKLNLVKIAESSRIEQVRLAKAQLSKAEALLAQRAREATRSTNLVREGAISIAVDQVAQTALAAAVEDVNAAREAFRIASVPRPEDVKVAQSQVTESEASLAGATQALALAQQALRQRLAQRQEVVQAQGQLQAARASRKVSEATRQGGVAQRQAALVSLAKTVIRSPFAGRVSQRLIEPGQTVNAGAPLLVLAGTSKLRVRLNVEESSIALLKLGANATVSFDAFPDLQLPAVITEIGSAANFQLGTIEVRLELKAQDPRLKPELTADANIVTSSFKNVIVLPRSTLMHAEKDATVYVLDGGIVRERPVTWSKGNAENVIILSGLKAGDHVITVPRGTAPGARVDMLPEKTPGAK